MSRVASAGGASEAGEGGSLAAWLVAGLLMLFAAIGLTVVAAGPGTVPGDVAIARAVQRPGSPGLDAIAIFASLVGSDFPSMVVLALIGVGLLLLLGRRDLALFLGVAASLRAIGPVLKVLIGSPRPTVEAVVIVAKSDGLGFPSGHALGAALFYGAVAIIAPQVVANRVVALAIQVAAAVAMVLITISRVRLGVHWPSDVVGGLLLGLAIVCLLQGAFLAWRQALLRT
ncbi:MAG: phosphoesterase, PA-phosphatase related [Thermomicrobiales bacterium]|nr:phosphoesterase, PA-phosphatase related [Thermomicrobiales bacterium]